MSAVGTQVDLGLRLLDDQLLDAEEHRCGRVDDIQLNGSPGKRTEVAGLLIGPGAWTWRLRRPFARVVEGLGPDHMHLIHWGEVAAVGTAVRLAHTAKELGLETRDGRNIQWVEAPPRGTLRVSELLRSQLYDGHANNLGRIWDVRVERQTKVPDEHVNEIWRVVGLITGRAGWKERIGVAPEGEPTEGETFTPWEAIQDVSSGVVTVTRSACQR
jgi:sporulation protein YlmC with PRC-barrel domain